MRHFSSSHNLKTTSSYQQQKSRQNVLKLKFIIQLVLQENVDISNVSGNVQLLQSQLSQATVNLNAQIDPTLKSGKIKRIHLKNFMCHSNFKVELNKNINVLVGLNGSGKSAILTALAIGLGSKATSTSRSTSLKDLVKQGEASATIEITLSNDGYDSFEGELTMMN